jgi:hypothetical protein
VQSELSLIDRHGCPYCHGRHQEKRMFTVVSIVIAAVIAQSAVSHRRVAVISG